jgi:hypothetical protein
MNYPTKTIFSVAFVLFTFFFETYAQQPSGQDAFVNTLNLGGQSNVARTWDNRYEGVRGTPYLKNVWQNAQIISIEGKVYNNVPLKYDVYSNLLAIKNSKGDSISTETTNIKEFTWIGTGMTFVKEPLLDNTTDLKNFGRLYQQIFKGNKTTLLKNYRKELLKADYQGGYNANRRYDELIDETDYYLKKDTQIEKIKLNEKNIVKFLADKEKEVKDFIKKQKLNLKNETDVVKLLQYYESL